jgi:hypothetical protein
VWITALVIIRQIHVDGALLKRLALFAVTGALVAMPVYYAMYGLERPLFQRFDTAGLGGSYWQKLVRSGGEQSLEAHLTWPFLMMVGMPERSLFYGGRTPLILGWVTPFFLLGAAYAVWRARHPGFLLLVLWVLAVSAGNMALATSAYAARYVVAFPALVLLIAAGIRYVVAARRTMLIVIAVGLAIIQVNYYFGEHLEAYNHQLRQNPDIQDALFRAAAFPPGTQVCVVTTQFVDEGFYQALKTYLADHVTVCFLTPEDVQAMESAGLPWEGAVAFFVDPYDGESARIVRDVFGLEGPFGSPFDSVPDDKQFYLFDRLAAAE